MAIDNNNNPDPWNRWVLDLADEEFLAGMTKSILWVSSTTAVSGNSINQ